MEFVICLHCSAQNKSANRCHTARNLQNYRMYGIEQNRSLGGVLSYGRANMRHLLKSEVLDALKESLCDPESLRMMSAIDPELVLLKQHLHRQTPSSKTRFLAITSTN